jgi:hypothetical protein
MVQRASWETKESLSYIKITPHFSETESRTLTPLLHPTQYEYTKASPTVYHYQPNGSPLSPISYTISHLTPIFLDFLTLKMTDL